MLREDVAAYRPGFLTASGSVGMSVASRVLSTLMSDHTRIDALPVPMTRENNLSTESRLISGARI